MSEADTLANAGNIKAFAKMTKSGVLTDASSGWNTFTFDDAYPVDPVVVAQGYGDGVSVQIKNVTQQGFDYRCLVNGADSDGGAFAWAAYISGATGSAVLDQVNEIIGTDYTDVSDLISNQTDFAKVCSNKQAMDILFSYGPAIDDIVSTPAALDTIMTNSTSWSYLAQYSQLYSQIKASNVGYPKWYFRTYGGTSGLSLITGYDALFNSSQYATLCGNQDAMSEILTSKPSQVCSSPKALNVMCKNDASSQALIDRWESMQSYSATMTSSLNNSSYFTKYSYVRNGEAQQPRTWALTADDPTGSKHLQSTDDIPARGACFAIIQRAMLWAPSGLIGFLPKTATSVNGGWYANGNNTVYDVKSTTGEFTANMKLPACGGLYVSGQANHDTGTAFSVAGAYCWTAK